MAADDSTLAKEAMRQAGPPSLQELPKLHQELGIWMQHTRYTLQNADRIPIWRVQNTSLVMSTGAGIGAYHLLSRVYPKLRLPLAIAPPFIIFYVTHRAAQVWQMPGLYESILRVESQLGEKAREILAALKTGGRLPSHEFGTQLPPRSGARKSTSSGGSGWDTGEGSDDARQSSLAPEWTWDSGAGQGDLAPRPGEAQGLPGADAPPTLADPWSDTDGGAAHMELRGNGQDAKGLSQPPRRTSWDEIRARNAAAQGQQSSPSPPQRDW